MTMIHQTAIVDKNAEIHPSCEIGPFCVVESGVILGEETRIGPHVHLKGPLEIGRNNQIHAGCVLGDDPQDFKFSGLPTRLKIGDNNVFREQVTIHRSNNLEEDTVIGHGNFFMAHSHVGHNSHIGNENILVNGALVAGHVVMGNKCILSGNAMVHQFVRIGSFSMAQGGAALSKDLPPFCLASGLNSMAGLNLVGMRRNGFDTEIRKEIKLLYHCLFMSKHPLQQRLDEAQKRFQNEVSRDFIHFVASSKRGVCKHGRE